MVRGCHLGMHMPFKPHAIVIGPRLLISMAESERAFPTPTMPAGSIGRRHDMQHIAFRAPIGCRMRYRKRLQRREVIISIVGMVLVCP